MQDRLPERQMYRVMRAVKREATKRVGKTRGRPDPRRFLAYVAALVQVRGDATPASQIIHNTTAIDDAPEPFCYDQTPARMKRAMKGN